MPQKVDRRSPWRLRFAAVLLYPATTISTDLLGDFWLDPYFPRGDFGLWASNFTIPICYFTGLFLLARSFYVDFPDWKHQLLVGFALLPFYTIAFGCWTFLSYPFGRISSRF